MQTDPIGYDDGPNWYNYVHGDPINGTDPSGNCGEGSSRPTQDQIDACVQQQIRSTVNNLVATSYFSGFMQNSLHERYGSLIPDTFNNDTPSNATNSKPACELCVLAGGTVNPDGSFTSNDWSNASKSSAILGDLSGAGSELAKALGEGAGVVDGLGRISSVLGVVSGYATYRDYRLQGYDRFASGAGALTNFFVGTVEASIPYAGPGIALTGDLTGANDRAGDQGKILALQIESFIDQGYRACCVFNPATRSVPGLGIRIGF